MKPGRFRGSGARVLGQPVRGTVAKRVGAVLLARDVHDLFAAPDMFKRLTVEVGLAGSPDVRDQVMEMVRDHFASLGWDSLEVAPVGFPDIRSTPVGVDIAMDWVDDPDAARGLLETLAAELTRAGHSGVIAVCLGDDPTPPAPDVVVAPPEPLPPARPTRGRTVLVAQDVEDRLRNPLVWNSLSLQVRLVGAPDVSADVVASVRAFFGSQGWEFNRTAPIAFPEIERTRAGVQMTMAGVERYDLFRDMLRVLARDLSRSGHSGVISVAKTDSKKLRLPDPGVPALTAGLTLNLDPKRVEALRGPYNRTGWNADIEATRRVLGVLLSWVADGQGALAYETGARLKALSDLDTGRTLILAEFDRNEARVGVVTLHPGGFRRVYFDSMGHVLVEIAGDSENWQSHVAMFADLIRQGQPWLRYAMVKRGLAPTFGYGQLMALVPAAPSRTVTGRSAHTRPAIEEHLVPDAFGLQMLGPGHLAQHPDISRWNVEEAGAKVLVSAPDIAAWFAPLAIEVTLDALWDPRRWLQAATPHEQQLADARADFATVVMTDQSFDEFPF